MHAVAIARVNARVVVIVKEQQRDVNTEMRLRIDQLLPELRHTQLVDHAHLSVHRQVKLGLIRRSVHLDQLADVGQVCFADEEARAGKFAGSEFVRFATHLLNNFVQAGLVVGFGAVELRIAEGVKHRPGSDLQTEW